MPRTVTVVPEKIGESPPVKRGFVRLQAPDCKRVDSGYYSFERERTERGEQSERGDDRNGKERTDEQRDERSQGEHLVMNMCGKERNFC